MVVVRIQQQDKYADNEGRTRPEGLLDVILSGVEEAINHIIVARRCHASKTPQHKQQV